MKTTRFFLLMMIVFLSVFIAACNTNNADREKPLVMTTLFPHFDMVREIAGDLVDVEIILPAGSDSHHFEPKPRQVARIKSADLVIYTGLELEPWMKSIIGDKDLFLLDLSKNIALIELDDHDDDDHDDDHDDESWFQKLIENFLNLFRKNEDDDDHEFDPHFWLDPVSAQIMANDIADALVDLLPEHETTLISNRDRLIVELELLHQEYLELFSSLDHIHIMHGGHNAFSYFAARYGVSYHTPFEGFSSDSEPKPQSLASMINLMNQLGVNYLYAEIELAPTVAQAISEQTGATILYLYNAENISKEDLELGLTYMEMMRHNFEQIKKGIGNES
jgi:zinc transport system substrate-binding protein